MVLFDLPTLTEDNRKEANGFRNTLLDMGFERMQFSAYLKFASSQAALDVISVRVEAALPPHGKVTCIAFTDKQYERMRHFWGSKQAKSNVCVNQYDLF